MSSSSGLEMRDMGGGDYGGGEYADDDLSVPTQSVRARAGGCCKKEVPEFRDIAVLDRDVNGKDFGTNSVTTAKYNLVTFFPKSIMEQFRRVANFWFLFMSLVMLVGQYAPQLYASPLDGWSCFGPLCIVIALTMLKVGVEDIGRHVADFRTNNERTTEVITQSDEEPRHLKWKDVRAGDIVILTGGDGVPADMVILGSSQEQGFCHIETSNIDGETNLKVRQALPTVREWCEAAGIDPKDRATTLNKLNELKGKVHCKSPNSDIHNFAGSLTGSQLSNTAAIDNDNVVLRGCTVRNCKWVAGFVVYTGKETKLMMKTSSGAHVKFSNMEKLVNKCILVILSANICLSLLAASFKQAFIVLLKEHWYLHLHQSPTILPGPVGRFISDFIVFMILFYNFVPLSVYITMEIVNLFHSFFINWDELMYDPITNTPAEARTASLSEDLGQIEYIFSDKTGTLTQNVMIFRKCTISPLDGRERGVTYGSMNPTPTASDEKASLDDSFGSDAGSGAGSAQKESDAALNRSASSRNVRKANGLGAIHDAAADEDDEDDGPVLTTDDCGCFDGGLCRAWAKTPLCACVADKMLNFGWWCHGKILVDADAAIVAAQAKRKSDAAAGVERPPVDEHLERDLQNDTAGLVDMMRCLSLCHTVVPSMNEETGVIDYEAESPDEGALVIAAREYGYALIARTHNSITITVDGAEETWEILAVNKFSSARKCMSMLLLGPNEEHVLWCKGADSVMLNKGGSENSDLAYEWLNEEILKMAKLGLRTLLLGKKELSPENATEWLARHAAASVSVGERDDALASVAADIENDLVLIAATGIEDKLQDEVPETIADLAVAGIKLWVLTGDKMETAINIGKTCKLLRPGMETIEIRGESQMTGQRLNQLYARYVPRHMASDAEQENKTLNCYARKIPWLRQLMRPCVRKFCLFSCCRACCGRDRPDEEQRQLMLGLAEGEAPLELAIIVDGAALLDILPEPRHRLMFELLARQCATVIACRVSPTQKALMVALVREHVVPEPITLAIGDGANDVDMIQAAGVGIGISGKEGLQAVNASDYSIAQFRFLSRLLLVHGRWNYRRMSMVLLYSFYKNITVALGTFVFSAFCGWSGQTPFDSWFYSNYNWFLGLPIVLLGLLERDITDVNVKANPRVYISGRTNMDIGPAKMMLWILNACCTVSICFFIPWLVMTCYDFPLLNKITIGGSSAIGGSSLLENHVGVYTFGSTVFAGIVNSMHMRCGLETLTWTWLQLVIFSISFAYFFIFLSVYSQLPLTQASESTGFFYMVGVRLVRIPAFWLLSFILVPISSLIFDTTMSFCRLQLCCTPVDVTIERERLKWPIPEIPDDD